jgi:hypothetical protein
MEYEKSKFVFSKKSEMAAGQPMPTRVSGHSYKVYLLSRLRMVELYLHAPYEVHEQFDLALSVGVVSSVLRSVGTSIEA